MKRRFTILTAAFALLAILAIPMGIKAAEGDVHDMSITQSTNLNNNASIPSIEIDEQSYSVKTVTINWRYNKTIENPVTIEVLVGEVSWGTQTITGNTTADAVFEGESTIGAIVINFTNNTGSGTGHGTFYVNSVKLTEGEGSGPAPTTYSVTFNAGDGTFVGNTDFPNASNTVEAGTYTLPSAERNGYTFDGWLLTGSTEPITGSYEVTTSVEFTAAYTENTTPSGDLTLTFPLNSNPGGWPTTQSSTLTEYTYALNGVDYTFALQNVKCGSGYLMIYSVGAVGLPAIEGYKLTKVVASNSGGCSTSTQVGISSTNNSASYIAGGAAQTWSTQSSQYTYNLTSTDANTMYYLYVTNKNAQVTSLALTYEAVDANAPSITASDVNINYDATSGSIAYTIENEPTPAGTLTASTTANWLTLGTATSSAVPFTCTANDNVISRTATVTLTYTYNNNTTTKDIIVTQGVDETLGTANNPYTVAQARTFIDGLNGATSTEKYVRGIVSQVDSYNSNYNSITYWISDDGTTTNQLEVYSGKGINGANFSSITDVEVTAEVVVKGNLKLYSGTYEFDKNNELVVYNGPQHDVEAPTFNPVAGTYAESQTVTISCATANSTIYYTLDGTEPTDASTQYTTALTISTPTTVKAIAYVGSDASTVTTATYHFCSAEDPYTVAEALAFTEYPANGIYVTGIVSTAAESLSSGTLTYYISVDGTTSNELEVYKGKGLNNEAFTAVEDIQAGDIVTVYGNVQVYNSTIEFASGNYLVSFERPVAPSITFNPNVFDFDAEQHVLQIPFTYENIEVTNYQSFTTHFYNAEGEEIQLVQGEAWYYCSVTKILEGEGYQLTGVVTANEGEARSAYMKVSALDEAGNTVYSNLVTINQAAPVAPATGDEYALYTGALVEGDYLIVYDGVAMNTTVTNDRLQYEDVTANNDVIVTDNAAIVWHIAPSGQYWTIYNADADAYAASTGAKNKAQMLADGTDDKALWTVSGTETYEFVNKKNTANEVNANLRKNGTYGFACYATSTGGALSLYKKVESTPTEYTLDIAGYEAGSDGGYYLIASPVTVDPSTVGMTTGEYDLYSFDQAQDDEWRNYKQNAFNLEPGKGYLYAKQATVPGEIFYFELTGTAYDGDPIVLKKTDGGDFPGWNLVGNPYTETAYIDRDFYVMKSDGSEIIAGEGNEIAVMQGFFVIADQDGEELEISTTAPTTSGEKVVLNVTSNRGNVIDRAIVRFGEGRQLPKFQLRENSTKISIAKDNSEYAVVRSEAEGEMPVSFKAENNGTYTFSVNTENVEMEYLHLIDNMTGADIDLIANPSYSFEAKVTDYASRFRLVFSANSSVNEQNANNFAFFNGNDWTINNEGEATLQVVDMTGRVLSTETVNGNATTKVNAATGVYMLRLINGNNIKTQKVVVK